MATISRRPKQKEVDVDPIFGEPMAQQFEDIDNEDKGNEPDPRDVKLQEMADRLAELQEKLNNQPDPMLLNQNWQSQTNDAPQLEDPNKIQLPDPALDPEGYDQAKAKRDEIRANNRDRTNDYKRRKDKEIDDKVADLKANFEDKYPEIAANKVKLEFIATQVANRAKQRGINVERYMFATQDRYIDDVAKEYIREFGDPADNDEDNDYQEDTSRSRRRPADTRTRRRAADRNREEEDDGRTSGVFGGQESSGRPNSRKNKDEDGPGSMIDDLQAMQRKSGFF